MRLRRKAAKGVYKHGPAAVFAHCEGFILYPKLTMKVLVLLLAATAMLDLALATPDLDSFPSMLNRQLDRQGTAPTSAPTPTQPPTGDQAVGTASKDWAEGVRHFTSPPVTRDSQLIVVFHSQEAGNMKCYVPGQCQQYSIDFVDSDNPDTCGHHCRKVNKDKLPTDESRCNWWSWEPGQNLCIMFKNCSGNAVNPGPDTGPCERCISGQGE